MAELSRLLKKYFVYSHTHYYMNFFLLCCLVICIITTAYSLRREHWAALFLVYASAAFILVVFNFLLPLMGDKNLNRMEGGNILFSIAEYFVFYFYFKAILVSRATKRVMFYFLVSYCILACFSLLYMLNKETTEHAVSKIADFLISTELLFLSILCLIYYVELFRKKIQLHLYFSPSFRIITALFIYTAIIAPFFLISDELRTTYGNLYYKAFALHYVSFGVLFIAISTAMVRRKPAHDQNQNI